jgi:hypothetical protein
MGIPLYSKAAHLGGKIWPGRVLVVEGKYLHEGKTIDLRVRKTV